MFPDILSRHKDETAQCFQRRVQHKRGGARHVVDIGNSYTSGPLPAQWTAIERKLAASSAPRRKHAPARDEGVLVTTMQWTTGMTDTITPVCCFPLTIPILRLV